MQHELRALKKHIIHMEKTGFPDRALRREYTAKLQAYRSGLVTYKPATLRGGGVIVGDTVRLEEIGSILPSYSYVHKMLAKSAVPITHTDQVYYVVDAWRWKKKARIHTFTGEVDTVIDYKLYQMFSSKIKTFMTLNIGDDEAGTKKLLLICYDYQCPLFVTKDLPISLRTLDFADKGAAKAVLKQIKKEKNKMSGGGGFLLFIAIIVLLFGILGGVAWLCLKKYDETKKPCEDYTGVQQRLCYKCNAE